MIDIFLITCAKGQICPHMSIAPTAERGIEVADKHDCGPHEAFRHVRYELLERVEKMVFDLCGTLTHGREHLEAEGCIANIRRELGVPQ